MNKQLSASGCAIIDIGSNSIRYMEENSRNKNIYTTRLGAGLAKSGMLKDAAMQRSMAVIGELVSASRRKGLTPFAYATSAVRDASNGVLFAKQIEKEFGVPVDILSGEREAYYAYAGAYSGCAPDTDGGVIDIGGASFQIVTNGYSVSFRAGCVRCADIARERVGAVGCNDAPEQQRKTVEQYLAGIIPQGSAGVFVPSRIKGVGGTITTLAALHAGLNAFNIEAVERVCLSRSDVENLIEALLTMGNGRQTHPLLTERHDVILYGAYILAYVMKYLDIFKIGISCSDGMEGYLNYLYETKKC